MECKSCGSVKFEYMKLRTDSLQEQNRKTKRYLDKIRRLLKNERTT